MRVILSIHDVMPSTLKQVARIIDQVPVSLRANIMLLVVPGLDWQPKDIDKLRQWSSMGMALAGHGWFHQTSDIKSIWHKVHSMLVSRDVAEHLSLTASSELQLMQRNREWFAQHNLPVCDWYVPPAWAFGRLPVKQRSLSGYRYFESTFFVYDGQLDAHHFLPMIGYEADTKLRKYGVKIWNSANRFLGRWRPIRMGIHPHDLDLMLAEDLLADLQRLSNVEGYKQVLTPQCH